MKLSIVIPVFNSSQILETLIQKIEIHVIRKKKNTQVILVNDHSLDDSWQKIRDLKKKYEFIKGVNLKKNYGQHK